MHHWKGRNGIIYCKECGLVKRSMWRSSSRYLTLAIVATIAALAWATAQAIEFQSSNPDIIPQWSAVIERSAERRTPATYRALEGVDQLRAVNRWANRTRYREDRQDHWKAPQETLKQGGDCEDYAILKFFALLDLGIPNDDMRILLTDGHAVLSVKIDGKTYVLDNRHTELKPLEDYKPRRAVNLTHHWTYID